jgi:hypothetical protein
MSRHAVVAGDLAGLLERFGHLMGKAAVRRGRVYPIIVIQEAGLDGFWIHQVLKSEGLESHVVDAASILVRIGGGPRHLRAGHFICCRRFFSPRVRARQGSRR